MIKPLQQILPALSGDICIACQLDISIDVKQPGMDIDETLYNAVVRNAELIPLTSNKYLPVCKCNLLTSDYSRDIRKFYTVSRDTFYNPIKRNTNLSLICDYPASNYNTDYSWGCRRIDCSRHSGYQYMFFAPLWTDGELPDSIEIYVKAGTYPEKRIVLPLQVTSDSNYLPEYLDRYSSELDDRVMRIDKDSKYCYIFGTSIEKGGFSTGRSRLCNDLWSEYRTVNRFDYILASIYKDSGYIIKQVLPLGFMFNLDNVLTYAEKRQGYIKVGAGYIKNNKKLSMYSFDTEYVKYNMPYQIWTNTDYFISNTVNAIDSDSNIVRYPNGIMQNKYPDNGIIQLNEGTADIYTQHLHKESPQYVKWELCGNDDSIPYIFNMSEDYNISGFQGRYYHTPLKVPYNYSLSVSNITESIKSATAFFNSYQGYWFDRESDNYSNVYHNTVLHRGILYNLDNPNIEKFGVDLNIHNMDNTINGPFIGLSKNPTDYSGQAVLFDDMITSMISGEHGIQYYPVNNLYAFKNNVDIPNIDIIGWGVPSFNPVLIEGYHIDRTADIQNYQLAQQEEKSILNRIINISNMVFSNEKQCISGYYINTDKVIEYTEKSSYIKVGYINNLSDKEWNSYVKALKAMNTDKGTRLYRMVNDGNGRAFYSEIFHASDVNQSTETVYRKIDGTIVDYADIEYDGNNTLIHKYRIPVILRPHISDNYIWMYNPAHITSKLIKKAMSVLSGNDYSDKDLSIYTDYYVWELNDEVYKEKYDIRDLNLEYTEENIINELVNIWKSPAVNFNIHKHLYDDLYNENGFITGLNKAINNGNELDYLGIDHINSFIKISSVYGLGINSLPELINFYDKGDDYDSIEADNIYRFDFQQNAFIEEAPISEMYITSEDMNRFYKQVLKICNEPESLLASINNSRKIKRWMPVRYKHDLDVAFSGNHKLYIAEHTVYDSEIGGGKRICYSIDLKKDDNKYYIEYDNKRYIVNTDILDGKTDLTLDKIKASDIIPELLLSNTIGSVRTQGSDFCVLINNSRFNDNKYKLWYIEELMPVNIIDKFIGLLKIKKATARFFHISYPSNCEIILSRPFGKTGLLNSVFDMLEIQEPDDNHNNIFISDYKNFMVPEFINDTTDLPYWNYTGVNEKKILRIVPEIEASKYNEVYKICRIPSANYKLNKVDATKSRLLIDLYVMPDRHSFIIDTSQDGVLLDTKDIISLWINRNDNWKLLPFIRFPMLSYLYSLPWSVYPEYYNMPCNLVSRNSGDVTTLYSIYSGNIEIFRYSGWIKPLLKEADAIPHIWGRYRKDSIFCDNYHDSIYGALFRNENGINRNPAEERYLSIDYTERGIEQNILVREVPECSWFNDSHILWLPEKLEYNYGIITGLDIQNDTELPYRLFKRAMIREGLCTGDVSDNRWNYLFFRYMVQYSQERIQDPASAEPIYNLTLIFNLK